MNKRKSAPTSPRALTIATRPVLAKNFAEQVLESETELDLDCNISRIIKLMGLYSVISNQSAIEYYESITDPKYLHYQDRLHNLLARKDVITLLNVGSPTAVARLKPSEILKKMQEQVAVRQKYRAHQVGMYMASCLPENRNAEDVMKKHNSENSLMRLKIIENLRNQETNDLGQRVEARRRRSGTPRGDFMRANSINSGIRVGRLEKYQEEVENIVEKCAAEKDEKVKELKLKYKEEIQKVKAEGSNSVINQVVQEMKKSLKTEIGEIEKDIREKRKQLIDDIKANYF